MDHELPLQPGITEKKTQESRNQSCAKLMKEAEYLYSSSVTNIWQG